MLAEIIGKIAQEENEERGESKYSPRPSSAGPDRCIRALAYHANGAPRSPYPGRALLVFDDGKWHEELTADWIRKSAYTLHSEQMEVETPVGPGHIDGVITDLLGVDRLFEHKAINHFTFERYWNGEYPRDYFAQVSLYIAGLQKVNPAIDEGLLLIKNKNTAAYLEFLLRYHRNTDDLSILEMTRSTGEKQFPKYFMQEINQNAVKKFAEVEVHKNAGTLPPRPFEYGTTFPCSYCNYAGACWGEYEREFKALESKAELDEELATKAGYYKEMAREEQDIKKAREVLRNDILARLSEKNVTGGRAGEFFIEARIQSTSSLDKSQIPADMIEKATTKKQFIVLNVKKIKGEIDEHNQSNA